MGRGGGGGFAPVSPCSPPIFAIFVVSTSPDAPLIRRSCPSTSPPALSFSRIRSPRYTPVQSFPEFSSPGLHLKELEYHPYVLNHLDPVLAIQAKHGIVSESYGPLTPLLRHPTGGPLKPVLQRIAQRLSKDTGKPVDDATVLLLWTVQKGVVAVTTSGNPDNIKKLVEVDSLPDLTDAELKEIEEVGRKVHFRHYKVGDL
jgi:diketogulonate reductase-like aldo/keto reductase